MELNVLFSHAFNQINKLQYLKHHELKSVKLQNKATVKKRALEKIL